MGARGVKQRSHEAAKARELRISRMSLNRYRKHIEGRGNGHPPSVQMIRRIKAIDAKYARRGGDRKAQTK